MGKPYVMIECATCETGIVTQQPCYIPGNPENFCSLKCAQLFYNHSVSWIARHRKGEADE